MSQLILEDTLTSIVQRYTEQLKTMKINRSKWEEERWTDSDIQECDRLIEQLASVLSDLNKLLKRIPDLESIDKVAYDHINPKVAPAWALTNPAMLSWRVAGFIDGAKHIKQFIDKSNG